MWANNKSVLNWDGVRTMSSDCDTYSVDLSAYFDGELEDEEIIALETHLADCDHCRGQLEKMEKLHNVIADATTRSIKRRPLFQEIMERIDQEEKKVRRPELVS